MTASPFDDIHLAWQGKTFTIPADRVMGAIKRIEDHLTLAELQRDAGRGTLRLGKMAAAYADVLRYAGAGAVTESDVYAGMFGEDAEKNVVGAVSMLLGMMIPHNVKLAVAKAQGGGPGEGNRRVRRAARRSSKRRSV
ncbi:hypothetical protein [Bradyrhizobium retamae]|uniref:Uncharacterized protein n=1 Tax=Bradyrhizobium retamae TaxID=1300035 RepID=A0A0R3MI55_9BRAD|nr:hypothetical protein [Bradyrhizobium retamae]KRR16864.1 hypothetical protein CQ13_36520 [Bradyrhizobium retamae]